MIEHHEQYRHLEKEITLGYVFQMYHELTENQ